MARLALAADVIFDGSGWHPRGALIVEDGRVVRIVGGADVPADAERLPEHTVLAPGFVDLQVNGGDGVMFNDAPDVAAIEQVCAAHARLGTTALLATIITDRPEVAQRFVAAGAEAQRRATPGFLGVHLEGPHISAARKGAHPAEFIRTMTPADTTFLVAARERIRHVLVTLAPESVAKEHVVALAKAGVVVSLGHTDADYDTAIAYAKAGATVATHLFNAMSQMTSRAPGMVGAVLDWGALSGSLIADGFHVHYATVAAALRAKRTPGRIFLVSDAMAAAGSDITSFTLAGRRVTRSGGKLTLDDGTLAGADTTMAASVKFLQSIRVDLTETLRMASLYPADVIGASDRGRLTPGARADIVALTPGMDVTGTWIGGVRV
ncbi:MAG TPA: N-acetylglucosamine-6-phosphate deacetylase [Bauldia sp.]|nr:N-acetylglucosamine-6-phosphate deacetylase [Bauldia sp.]